VRFLGAIDCDDGVMLLAHTMNAIPWDSSCSKTLAWSLLLQRTTGGISQSYAALSALASDPFVKLAVVVDEDVDIHNEAEVMWAIATRTQPDRDTFFVPDSATSRLDPASYSIWNRWDKDTMNTKWAIDATKPVEAPFEERADVPREAWENLDLSDYVSHWK
jgi:UbiD family decarboxylase